MTIIAWGNNFNFVRQEYVCFDSFLYLSYDCAKQRMKDKNNRIKAKKKIKENKQNERVQKRVICIVDITCTRYTKKENEKMVFSTGRKKNSFFSSASFV